MTLYIYDPAAPEEPKRHRVWPFLAGTIAGALVVAIVWWGASALAPETRPAGAGTSAHHHPPAPTPAGTGADGAAADDSDAPTYLERCREVLVAQQSPLKAAADSMAQWEVHIGAMNKLVTGAITLQQATQFWNQTRVGAAHRLERAAEARRAFGHRTARCPGPTASVQLSPLERSCRRAVEARNRTLRLATTALGTWRVHVHHMEMLRRGEMTPEEATQMWLQSWHTGDEQVRAYRSSERESTNASC